MESIQTGSYKNQIHKNAKKGVVRISDIYVFFISISVFLSTLLYSTTLSDIGGIYIYLYQLRQLIWATARIFIFIKILLEFENRDWKILVLLLFGIMSSYWGTGTWVVNTVWFICGMKHVDIQKVLKYLWISQLIACGVIIFLAMTGQISNTQLVRADGSVRYSMGFFHPNTFAAKIFQLAAMYVCMKREKLNYGNAIVFAIFAFLVYRVTDSKTASILLIALAVLSIFICYANNKKGRKNTLLRKCVQFIFDKAKYAAILIPFLATYVVLNSSSMRISFTGTLASRASQAVLYFNRYGITPFGNALEINSGVQGWSLYSDYYTLDNSYLYLLLGYGVIFFALFLVGEILLFAKTAKEKNYALLTVLMLYAVYGLTETTLIQIDMNFSLLFLAPIVWQRSKRRNGKFRLKVGGRKL